MQLFNMTARQLSGALKRKEINPSELAEAYIQRIEALDCKVGAYITVMKESALIDASGVKEIPGENRDAFSGVPIAISDNICTSGVKTTCASKMLENFIPPYDATVVKKIKLARMPILGKTNMDEFSMGSSTEYSSFGSTKNPWDLTRVPGGASGGAAAAVAAGLTPWAIGSDTGGSVRHPASFCGVVGLKPTYGLVSRFGLIAYASSLEQIGLFAKDIGDCANLLRLICGHDPYDATSLNHEVPDFAMRLGEPIKNLKIGVPSGYKVFGLDDGVEKAFYQSIARLEKEGAQIVEISLPNMEYALECYYIIASAEASSNLARFDGVRYGYQHEADDVWTMFSKSRGKAFGPEVKRRLLLGAYALSTQGYEGFYLKALKVRNLIRQDFISAFNQCDVIATPTTPTTAFTFREKARDPLEMYKQDIYTIPANLGGFPALSIPIGKDSEGLPIGMQLLGPTLGEEKILSTAGWLEQLLGPVVGVKGLEVELSE